MKNMKKFMACLMVAFTVVAMPGVHVFANEITQEVNEEKIEHLEDSESVNVAPDVKISLFARAAKPALAYNAHLSVDSGIAGGMTVTGTSESKVKSTGKAIKITSIKTIVKIECKDGTTTSKTVTKKNASKGTCSYHKNYLKSEVKKCKGEHYFVNTGYTDKKLSTSVTP